MTLRCSLMLLTILGIYPVGLAQQWTVFIIDTVVSNGAELDVSHVPYTGLPYQWGAERVGGDFDRSSYPNYRAEFARQIGLPIQMPLTTGRGSLHILVADSIGSDTIRIQRFELLPSCSWDTTHTTVAWYRMGDPSDQFERREDSIRPAHKRACKSYALEIRLTVNDTLFTVPIHPRLEPVSNVVKTFHGYKPRRCQGLNPHDKGYQRCLRMDGSSNTRSWSLFGELRLF